MLAVQSPLSTMTNKTLRSTAVRLCVAVLLAAALTVISSVPGPSRSVDVLDVVGLDIAAASADRVGPSDGCTLVPNSIRGVFDFTHACQHHDACYVNRGGKRQVDLRQVVLQRHEGLVFVVLVELCAVRQVRWALLDRRPSMRRLLLG